MRRRLRWCWGWYPDTNTTYCMEEERGEELILKGEGGEGGEGGAGLAGRVD